MNVLFCLFSKKTNRSIVAAHQQRGMWWKEANDNQTHHDYQMSLQQNYEMNSIVNSAIPIDGHAKRTKVAQWPHLYLERIILDGPLIYQNTHDIVGYENVSVANEWPFLPFQQQAYPSLMLAGYENVSVANEWCLLPFQQQSYPSLMLAENEWPFPSMATPYMLTHP